MKGVREFYDRTAADWAEKWYSDDTTLPLLQKFMEFLPEHPRVLDLCCGAGYESMRLAQLGAVVSGIDLSPESIAIAKVRNPQLEFFVDDMRNDYSYVGSMDGIVCIAGLVHLTAGELPLAFRRMAQVLRPGGYALIVVRDGEGKLESQSRAIIDGETYDRAFYAHNNETLAAAARPFLDIVCEIPDDPQSMWRNYIYQITNQPGV